MGAAIMFGVISVLFIAILIFVMYFIYKKEKATNVIMAGILDSQYPKFMGCWQDGGTGWTRSMASRALKFYLGADGKFVPATPDPTQYTNYVDSKTCLAAAKSAGYTYAGLQDGTPSGTVICLADNSGYDQYGPSVVSNCSIGGVGYLGAAWTNAVYQVSPTT